MALLLSRNILTEKRPLRIVATILFSVMASATAILPAAPDSVNDSLQRDGERQLEEGRVTLDAATLTAAKNSFAECVRQDPKNAPCEFELARAESYLVQAENIAKHSDASKRWLDDAISNAQKAIAINDHLANAHALLGDLYGEKIGGMISAMRYGPKANAETARALQLDPNNAFAYAVQGRKYFFTPSAFGGDVDKAIESFKRATAIDPQSDEDFVWLAKAYKKKGDEAHEQEALSQALRLNSRSAFAHRVQSGQE
jgi:tetratricopeptide (TPR) repeat protein